MRVKWSGMPGGYSAAVQYKRWEVRLRAERCNVGCVKGARWFWVATKMPIGDGPIQDCESGHTGTFAQARREAQAAARRMFK